MIKLYSNFHCFSSSDMHFEVRKESIENQKSIFIKIIWSYEVYSIVSSAKGILSSSLTSKDCCELNHPFHIGMWSTPITLFRSITLLSGLTILCGILHHSGCMVEYSIEFFRSHVTLLWIWIMLCHCQVDFMSNTMTPSVTFLAPSFLNEFASRVIHRLENGLSGS